MISNALAAGAALVLAAPAVGQAHLSIPARANQLIVVSSPTPAPVNYLATLQAYARANASSPWRPAFGPWPAETGYGHLRRHRHEGDGSTPIGVFGIAPTMYGNDRRPSGVGYRYHRLVCGDWWDEDPFSPRYNRFVHVACGTTPGFASWSERLWTETTAYPYFAVLTFNTTPIVRGPKAPGSGIFLHSWVDGPTAGCVALPQARLLRVLRWLRPARHPAVEIGPEADLAPLSP
jgi:L,D-peptidoglycan transpeptidase YkuD (ErfK/YbiS/YcfS/YnhG family)